jgi:hypothetical protein
MKRTLKATIVGLVLARAAHRPPRSCSETDRRLRGQPCTALRTTANRAKVLPAAAQRDNSMSAMGPRPS